MCLFNFCVDSNALYLCSYAAFFQLFWRSSKTNVLNMALFVPASETRENLIFSNKYYILQNAYKNETAVLCSSKLNKGRWKAFAFHENQCFSLDFSLQLLLVCNT